MTQIKSKQVTLPDTTFARTFADAASSMVAKEVSADDMLLAIMEADTLDDILGSSGAIGLDTMVGEPFTINSADLRESDYKDGLGAYIVMHSTMDDGSSRVITSGATTVVAQVVALTSKGLLPARVSSRKPNKATANGYFPVNLCKPEPVEESF